MKSVIGIMYSTMIMVCLTVGICAADTTVEHPDIYSWGGNIGWTNWEGDVTNGAVFTENYASGYIYSANCGWINLGDGSPANGISYSNTSADDFGVNVDSLSDPDYFMLSGYAWGANIGWINFDVAAQAGASNQPRIDKTTGILKGYAWSANTGWLTLESPGTAVVRTGLVEDRCDFYDFEFGNDWTWWAMDSDVLNAATGLYNTMPGTDDWALGLRSWDKEAGMGHLPELCYGYWQSPSDTVEDRVPYLSDTLYKVTWSIVAGHDSAAYQPGLRFRMMVGSSSCGADMVIQEFGGYKPLISPDVNDPTEISHYWYPPQWLVDENVSLYPGQSGLTLYAEMFDNRTDATGTYWIPRVDVFALEPPADETPVFTAPPFETSVWRDITRAGLVSSSIHETDGLTIDYPSTPTTDMRVCFWEFVYPAVPIPIEENTLYRVTFTVTSSGDTPPVFRERLLTRYLYLGSESVITPTVPWGATFDYAKPGATPREIVCYLPIEDQFFDGDDLTFSLDTYGPLTATDPYEGSYTVSDIKVEMLDLP